MMIILSIDFFIPEVKNRSMSRLLNACFAILSIASSVWLLHHFGFIYETSTAFIRTTSHNSSSNSIRIYMQTTKFPPFIFVHDSASKMPLHLSSSINQRLC